ncbi:hypothetical protein M2436_007610 [Streptomyces sp. HB372]|nr:hypothetical protein [Streptomyces sp. HB372]
MLACGWGPERAGLPFPFLALCGDGLLVGGVFLVYGALQVPQRDRGEQGPPSRAAARRSSTAPARRALVVCPESPGRSGALVVAVSRRSASSVMPGSSGTCPPHRAAASASWVTRRPCPAARRKEISRLITRASSPGSEARRHKNRCGSGSRAGPGVIVRALAGGGGGGLPVVGRRLGNVAVTAVGAGSGRTGGNAAATARAAASAADRRRSAAVETAVYRAVPASMFGQQRQVHRGLHRTVRAQHRVRQLEHLVAPGGQTLIELSSEA